MRFVARAETFSNFNFLVPEDEIESLKGSVNLGKKIERKVLANRSLSYNETALIMSPMDRLNLDILGNSMDTDEGFSSSGSSSESGNTMKEILALLKSIDSKVSRLERRFDDLERKINGKAGDQKSSLLEKFVGLSIGGNGAFNVLQWFHVLCIIFVYNFLNISSCVL